MDATKDYHKLAKNKNGIFIKIVSGIGTKALCEWQCGTCEHIWRAKYGNIKYNDTWCPKCAKLGRHPLTIDACHNIATKNDGYCLETIYIDNKYKMLWMCKNNHRWRASFKCIKRGSWCPTCYGNKKLSIEHCRKLAIDNGGYCLSTEYIGSHKKYIWKCKEGHIWAAEYGSIQQGSWCPDCTLVLQKKTQDIFEKLLKEKAERNYTGFKWFKDKRKLQMDMWFNKYKLCVEVDGQQHFMPVRFGGISIKKAKEIFRKIKQRDNLKNKLIKTHHMEIKYFIRIKYDEPITKEYISKKLQKHGIKINLEKK